MGIYATQEIGRHKQRGMGREEKRRAVFKVYDVNITFFGRLRIYESHIFDITFFIVHSNFNSEYFRKKRNKHMNTALRQQR